MGNLPRNRTGQGWDVSSGNLDAVALTLPSQTGRYRLGHGRAGRDRPLPVIFLPLSFSALPFPPLPFPPPPFPCPPKHGRTASVAPSVTSAIGRGVPMSKGP